MMISQNFRGVLMSIGVNNTLRIGASAACCYGLAYWANEIFNPVFELYGVISGDLKVINAFVHHDGAAAWAHYAAIYEAGFSWVNCGRCLLSLAFFALLTVLLVEALSIIWVQVPRLRNGVWLWMRHRRTKPIVNGGYGASDFPPAADAHRRMRR